MAQKISKREAKEIIEESSEGFLMVYGLSPRRVLGTVPVEDRDMVTELKTYKFEDD